jgi:SanA protein
MIFRWILILLIAIPAVLLLARLWTGLYSLRRTFSVADAPQKRVAIVFGAGLWRDGSPTPVLRDRVATAAELYFAGKVEKLLMSGDNRFVYYNEPAAMREYALQLGVPDEAIVLDYAGRRTYDTCYLARDIFGLQEAILVTQRFHLPRAVYTCNRLGLAAVGVPADRRDYHPFSLAYWNLREAPATLIALWEVNISRPLPVLGDPEPIFPLEAQ